jgi:hypothetical protein
MATAVGAQAQAFQPEVLWVLGELSAVHVGLRVADRLAIPLHVTVHDAPEECRFAGIPPVYGFYYRQLVRRLLRKARSVDTVSQELFQHLLGERWIAAGCEGVTLPPSVPREWTMPQGGGVSHPVGGWCADTVRRIGMCGSLRVGRAQWRRFLDLLGCLPFKVEIVLFGSTDDLGTAFPSGVTVRPQPYADSEEAVVSAFRAGVDACYLGLWREPERALFARTSLSSKLVTYAAAGRPIVVDAPENSVAWRLVSQYGAGILLSWKSGDGRGLDRGQIIRLLSDAATRQRMAEGAVRLCRGEFDLGRNIERLAEALRGVAR